MTNEFAQRSLHLIDNSSREAFRSKCSEFMQIEDKENFSDTIFQLVL